MTLEYSLVTLISLISLFILLQYFYKPFSKRFLDIILSGLAIVILLPLLIFLTITGSIMMKGNPFFIQPRPGKQRKIFKLIKFRTMTCEKNEDGELLPDDQRLNKYGRFLRSTSLDELPELINIFIGHMSIVGPRPLLVEYLPLYTPLENQRHDVRPGLTGWAQVNGRNAIDSWEQRFLLDIEYINNLSFVFDLKIIFLTISKVLKRSDIYVGSEIKVGRLDDVRRNVNEY